MWKLQMRSVFRWVKFAWLLGVSIHTYSLAAREELQPYDDKDHHSNIRYLSEILQEQNPRYQLLAVDLFEGEKQYFAHAPSNMLSVVDYVFKTPFGFGFQQERALIKKYLTIKASFEQSLTLQTSFTQPGRDNYVVRLRHPIPLSGKLLRASLWVHSQDVPHILFLLFRSSHKRSLAVSAGSLSWNGWRRIHFGLPQELSRVKRLNNKQNKHYFLGFRIKSLRQAELKNSPASIALLIDNLLILTDLGHLFYPGANIKDNF